MGIADEDLRNGVALHAIQQLPDIHRHHLRADFLREGVDALLFELDQLVVIEDKLGVVGMRDFGSGVQAGDGLVDGVQRAAHHREGIPAGFAFARHADENLLVLVVGFDQRQIVAALEHHARAPDGVLVDEGVHADDEARDDAAGQDAVVELEGQRIGPIAGEGFFARQQVGDQVFAVVAFEGIAQLELAHHVHDEHVTGTRVGFAIEHLAELLWFRARPCCWKSSLEFRMR